MTFRKLHESQRETNDRLQRIEEKLSLIIKTTKQMANTLANIQSAVAGEDTVIDSAITLLNGLAAQVAALEPNQAAIDALAADITNKTEALAAAVTANTSSETQS